MPSIDAGVTPADDPRASSVSTTAARRVIISGDNDDRSAEHCSRSIAPLFSPPVHGVAWKEDEGRWSDGGFGIAEGWYGLERPEEGGERGSVGLGGWKMGEGWWE